MAEELFVDKHRVQLIQRVTNIAPILDELFSKNVIKREIYEEIISIAHPQEKMRALFSGPLRYSVQGKEIFYNILKIYEPFLISELDHEYENVVEKEKAETVLTKEMLFETLNDLSSNELDEFKSLIESEKDFPFVLRSRLKVADTRDTVELMVETDSLECVGLTKKVLKRMNRTDLMQRLSGVKDKQWPSLTQRVETMASVIELLLETLAGLSDREIKKFKEALLFQTDLKIRYIGIPLVLLEKADMQDTVFLMVQTYGQQSVETTKEVLKKMEKTDLVQRLSDSSSGPKKKHSDEHRPALIQKAATVAAVKQLLLETLNDLSNEELKKFKEFLQMIVSQKNLPNISLLSRFRKDRGDLVDQMVQTYGQQSLELTMEILNKMNRTDLMQRLSETSSGLKEKHSVDEHRPARLEKASARAAVKQVLLETLRDLSNEVLEKFMSLLQFTYFQKGLPQISWRRLGWANSAEALVDLMVENQQSVEVTKEVFMDMNRTDLVERLSVTISRLKDYNPTFSLRGTLGKFGFSVKTKCSVLIYYEHRTSFLLLHVYLIPNDPALHQEIDRREFSHGYKRILKPRPEKSLKIGDRFILTAELDDAEICPEKLKLRYESTDPNFYEVLIKNPDTDFKLRLMQENKPQPVWTCVIQKDEYQSSTGPIQEKWFQTEATMTQLMEKLLVTLEDLSDGELDKFKRFLHHTVMKKDLPRISRHRLETADRVEIVELMVESYGHESAEVTRRVLMAMNRGDLVQNWSDISSGSKEKHQSKPIQRGDMMTSLMDKLLETLEDLSDVELEYFKHVLRRTMIEKGLQRISGDQMETADRDEIVELMVETYGQQCLEVTTEALKMMNRDDLVQKLSDISSGSKEKHQSKPVQRGVTMTPLMKKLLVTLRDLSDGELEMFKHVLKYTDMKKGLPRISGDQMETADRNGIVELMVETYGQQSLEVTTEALKTVNRKDLVQKLSDISSGSQGPSRSSELEGGGSIKQVSSDWIQLEPEVNSTDEDEAPTYSLQSEAGHFECSVSGLRWVCKESVSFKYQFCSVKEHMEMIEILQYLPAGPLIDITVVAGKLDVVYLPHWICIDDNPTILDKFAVLHIDDCGAVVENVSEVTSSHVKLSEPVFSLKMVLVKLGFSVEIDCKVLIYKTNTSSLTLHVYQIPPDRVLIEELDKTDGYTRIRKQHPKQPLQIYDWFTLTADLGGEEIYSDTLIFKYEPIEPNFFEVSVKNPDTDLVLKLKQENTPQPVWTCVIPTDENLSSQITGPVQDKPSVDERLSALMKKAAAVRTDKERLLIMLEDLKMKEFDSFTWHLQNSDIGGDEHIPSYKLENISMRDLVDEMWKIYIQKSVEVTKKVLENINRNDLVKILSETSSGSNAAGSSA